MGRFIILGAILIAVSAGPIQRSTDVDTSCSKTCTASSKYSYVPGKTYEFHYDTEIQTSVQGSSENHAGVHMTATVHIEVLTKCELVMRLSDVNLEEHDPIDLVMKSTTPSSFSDELERYPLRISFQDGNVDELCLVAEEPRWVVNVKRGILSVFQNNFVEGQSNSTLTETDVAGNCVTDYTSQDGWYSTVVKKSKNLLSCTERNGFNTAIQGVPYSADSGIQSLPIIKNSHECEHEIDKQSHHLTSATCREQHMFRPFARGDSGAVTHSTQKLKLIQQTHGTRPLTAVLKRTSLKYEHTDNMDQETNTRKELERKLMQICEATKLGVTSDTPRLFSDLVYVVRTVDARTLSETYRRIQEGSVCSENKDRVRKFLLDTLPIAGTSASLSMMTDLLTRKLVTGLEASMWLTSLAFIKNPTQDMLSQVKPLLSMSDNEDKALLSVGSLIHSYCTSNGECDRDTVVQKMVATIESKIAKGCKVNNGDVKSTLIALRAIGNAGYAYGAIPTLSACMKFSGNPTEIRLSAIEAFRRMPCDADQVELISIFLDTNEDSEIRIAAYKALMECPSEAVIDKVKKTLEAEEVNQVGSYVWSHLTNLMETSDRHKQYIRDILDDQQLQKEFDLDKRKFSRNYEGSFFLEKLNTGAKIEGDMIWSQKSFIPRSAMLNLTVDLFGHSVNLLELGGRAEGLEFFMESFFGPNGYFSQNVPDDEETDLSKSQTVHPAKVNKLDSRYKPTMNDLKAAMYMRVFGNELRYMNIHGLDWLLSGPNINILEVLTQLSKDNEYSMTHNTMFLDSSMVIPTGSGFPMNLTVNGTATIDLRLKGKMDLKNLPTVDIDGLIQPSAAIDISSMMSVDAYATRTGIKMISTLHTNTAVMGKLQVSPDGLITAEYEMPQPRMDIISVRSSFFTIHNNLEKEQKMITDNQQTKSLCSPSQLVTITGLELCAELTYPNASLKSDAPYFPLTGPVTAGIFLYNRDTHKKYKMEARSLHTSKNNILHFSFDTPESKISRHVSFNINLDKTALTLDMTMTSPWKKANFQGALTLDRFVKGISGKVNLDGDKRYTLNAQLNKERVKNAYKYSPSLEITLPNKQPYTVSGMFMYDGTRQFDLEFDMNRVTQKPVKASGTLFNKPNLVGVKGKLAFGNKDEYSIDISNTMKPYKAKTLYKPFISIRTPAGEVVAFGGTAQYIYGKKIAYNFVLDKVVDKKVTLKGFLQKLVRKRNRILYRSKVNFASSPMDLSLDAKLDNRNYKTIATDIDLTYVIRKVTRNSIKLVSKVNNLSSRALLKGKSSLLLTMKRNPELNVKMIGNLDHSAKHTEADLDLHYGADFGDENKHLEFALDSNRMIKSLSDVKIDGQMRLRHTGQDLNMVLKGNHMHTTTDLDSSVFMKFGRGEPIESTLQLSDRTTALLDVTGLFTLNYPGRQIILNETIRQPQQDKYVSDFNGQLRKGQKNFIVTSFTRTSVYGGRMDADVHMHQEKPYHVDAEWSTDPAEIYMRGSYQNGVRRYAGSLTTVNIPSLHRLVTEIEMPDRHVKLALDGKPMADLWSGSVELDLDMNKDNSPRVSLTGWLEPVEPFKRLNVSLSLTYPERTLTLNAHNIIGAKITSHADFAWETNKQINVDFIYGLGDSGDSKQILSKAMITTPFETMKMVSVDLSHTDALDEYKTEVDLRWQPHSVATTTIIRKPVSFRTIVGSLEASTSLKEIKNMRFEIDHKLSDSLASAAKFSLNRMFVHTEIVLVNQTKPSRTAYKGDVNIRTSYAAIKKGTISFSHNNNGITYTTEGDFLRNRKKYGFKNEITHQPYDEGIRNVGSLQLFCPHGNSETLWSHRNSQKDSETVFSTKWGDGKQLTNEIMLKTTGGVDIVNKYSGSVNGSIELTTPFSFLSDIKVQLNHVHKDMKYYGSKPFIDSSLTVLKDQREIASVQMYRESVPRLLTSYVSVTIPDLDIDSRIRVIGKDPQRDDDEDASISFEVVITPDISGSLLLKAMFDKSFHAAVEFKSSFPDFRQITYTFDASLDKYMDEDQLSVIRRLYYSDGKVIEIATKVVLDRNVRRGFISIKTPYDTLQKFEGDIVTTGDPQLDSAFTWDSYIEVLPHFERISQSLSWDVSQGVQGRLRIDTPFKEFSNLEANIKYDDRFRQGSVGLDYSSSVLPRYPVQIEVSRDMSDANNYELSAKMSVPLHIQLSHKGNVDNFNCKAELGLKPGTNDYGLEIGFKSLDKIEGTVTVSLPSRRDITGYFSHYGTATSFTTHAEILHNRKNQLLSDFSFSSNGDLVVSGSASLKSDLLQLPDAYDAVFRHEGWPKNFKTHAEFSSTGLGKSEADFSFDMRNDIDSSILLTSPWTKHILSSFNLHSRPDYLETRLDYTQEGNKLVDFLATADTSDVFSGHLSLRNPFSEDIKALIRINGQIESFTAYTEFVHGSDKSETETRFSKSPKLQGKFSLKTPYWTDFSTEFDHNGTLTSFKSHGEYTVGSVKTEGDISVDIGDEIDFRLKAISPAIDEIQITYHHTGSYNDFTCHAVYTRGFSRKEATLKFENKNSPKLDFTISAPELKVNLNHAGHVTDFKSHGEVIFDNERRVADITVQFDDKIVGSLTVTAPMFSLKVNQNGDLLNFVSNIEIVDDYDRYALEAQLSTNSGIDASLQLNSPTDGYENIKATYTHDGSFKSMNFKCHGELSMPDSLSVGDLKVNLETAFEGSFSLSSPAVPDVNAEFDHSWTNSMYKSNAEVSVDHDTLAGINMVLDYSSGLEGDILLQTPFTGYRHIRSSGKYSGDLQSFSLHQEILLGTDKHEINVNYGSKPKHVGSLSVRTPLLPEINADFSLAGKLSQFTGDTKLILNGMKKIGVSSTVNMNNGIKVDFDIVIPVENFTRIDGQLTQTLDRSNMQHEAQFSIEGRKIFMTTAQFSDSDKISASGLVDSVFFNPVKASVEHKGNLQDFTSSGEIFLNDERWAANVAFSKLKDLDASFNIDTPQRDRIRGKLHHSVKPNKAVSHVELELDSSSKYELDSSVNWKTTEATFNMKTPIEGYEDNSLTLSHDGKFPNIKSSARLTYPDNELSISTDLSHGDKTSGKITLVLPIQDWEHTDLSFSVEGSQPNVKALAEINFATGNDIIVSAEHKQLGWTDVYKFYLMSPYTEEIDMSFNHTGGLSYNFDNSFELTVGQDIKIDIDSSLKTGSEYISYSYINKMIMSGETATEKITFNHKGNLENFRTDALVSFQDKFVQMETSFQMEPAIEGSVSLHSSFEAIKDKKVRFSHTGNLNGFMTTGELQYAPDGRIDSKVDFTNNGWKKMVTDIELRTPFKGYSFNRISYEHKGDSESFQCNGEIVVGEKKITGAISGSKSPWSLGINIHTPFKDFEQLMFNGNIDIDGRGRYTSRIETSWNPSKPIVLDGSLTALESNQLIEGSMSVSSPFDELRRLAIDFTHRKLSDKYIESLKVNYNGKDLVDIELDESLLQAHKTASLTVRSPKPMKLVVDGEFSLPSVNAELTASWNNDDPNSNIRVVAGYDFRPRMSDKTVDFKLTGAGHMISYSGSLDIDNQHSKSDFAWGENTDQKIGYDITFKRTDTRAKIILPTRSIQVAGSNRDRITECTVMWDADNDQTKKVGFRSVLVPSADSIKAYITLMLPSLGKNVQVDSEMVMNRGKIIFDAKTELSYSADTRKKLVITSKLEDISSLGTKNYSLSLGLSHPYSTVGIKMDSHVGQSENQYTGSVGLDYMTARRQTKTFQVRGQIDQLRKTVSFELVSPLKTISISGSTQTGDQFRVSFLNVYDNRQPLNTVITLDSMKRTVSLVLNYDEDSPNNELHLTAGYINSSAVAAEIFRITRGVKVTDALLAVRLNNSQLLHNRLHWRPEIMNDLKNYFEGKSANYKHRLSKSLESVVTNMDYEKTHKLPLIRESLEELFGEVIIQKINEVISPVFASILEGVDDFTDDVIMLFGENIRQFSNKTSIAYQNISPAEKLSAVMTDLSNSDILKYARNIGLADKPLSRQAGYIVDMLRDQIKVVPYGIGRSLKNGVGNVLPETLSQHVSNANKYWELEDNLDHVTNSVLQWVESEVKGQLRTLENGFVKTVTLPNYIYDPAHGEIQVVLHLPIPLTSLDSLPEIPKLSSFAIARNVKSLVNNMPLLGDLNRYVPDFSGELMPPFKAYASIKNGHRITTFDGYDYDLPLDCTFVLAKDFMDGNFSLILSNDGETSLTVLAKGKQLILKLSGEVSVDGESVDLPYYYKNLAVTSPVDGLILVDGANSFSVSWDTAEDHIQVTINGWYYGKTGGLLGVYDNEPSNDLMTPFGKVIDSTRRFASTWDVGKTNCR